MYLKSLFLAAGVCFAIPVAQSQTYSQVADSCFASIAASDTAKLEWLYPQLPDLFEIQVAPQQTALRTELLAMRNCDQGIRLLLLEARKRYGDDSETARALHSRMKRIDASNAIRIQQIIDLNGWQGKDEIGEEANETLFLCIQHVDDLTVQEKYLPVLEQAVQAGTAEGWHYAFLVDRIRMNRGEKQVYGTQTITRGGDLDYVVPLEDVDQVDSLRRSVGLEPMSEYLEGQWDPDQYKRDLPEIERKYKSYTQSRKAAPKKRM